jgi:hypothetical protein
MLCERERKKKKFDHKCLFQSLYNIYFELVDIKNQLIWLPKGSNGTNLYVLKSTK